MINRLRLYDPDFDDVKMPDLNLAALEPKRQTHIEKDKYGEVHIMQKRDGIMHAITLDRNELMLVLSALSKLYK